jgi:rubrerythrin
MNLETAIRTALEYEGRVHAVYADAMERATNDVAKRVFRILCNEEKEHLHYLKERLDEWQETGTITVAVLDTAIPGRDDIQASVDELRSQVSGGPSGKHDAELEMLKAALKVEVETSEFYRRMVDQLDSVGRRLFRRFVEIEEGHRAIVQAEIDCVSGLGFWFDTPEFRLEAG